MSPAGEYAPLTDEEQDIFWFTVPDSGDHVVFRYAATMALEHGVENLNDETEDTHMFLGWYQGTWTT